MQVLLWRGAVSLSRAFPARIVHATRAFEVHASGAAGAAESTSTHSVCSFAVIITTTTHARQARPEPFNDQASSVSIRWTGAL